MSLWSWLFGEKKRELEEDGNRLIDVGYVDGKRHGPYKRFRKDNSLLEEGAYIDGKRHGPFVIHGRDEKITGEYLDDELHGIWRITLPDGTVKEEKEYVRGEVVRGPWEKRDHIHTYWIKERGTMVRGERDGLWEEFGIPKQKGEMGPLLKRCHYKHGVLDGRYETFFYYDNKRDVEGAYADGKRVGHWTYRRHDGSISAELDYDAGRITGWKWFTHAGKQRPLVEVADDEEVARWIALADAWDEVPKQGTYGVELSVDRWPTPRRPLAWIDERIAAGERPKRWDAGNEWLALMTDSDEIDPRTKYVDAIELDHHAWDVEQTRRLRRFAGQIVSLSLLECVALPDLSALFESPWPRLESLSLHECGEVDATIDKLASAPWAMALTSVAFTYEPLSSATVARLVEAPWFASLHTLALTIEDRAAIDMLATKTMPSLRTLEIDGCELEDTDVAILRDRLRRPALTTLLVDGAPR